MAATSWRSDFYRHKQHFVMCARQCRLKDSCREITREGRRRPTWRNTRVCARVFDILACKNDANSNIWIGVEAAPAGVLDAAFEEGWGAGAAAVDWAEEAGKTGRVAEAVEREARSVVGVA